MPSLCAHAPNFHKGYDLYSAGPAAGLLAFVYYCILYRSPGIEVPTNTDLGDGEKLFGEAKKAGFISLEWWPDFCNWRRSQHPAPEEGSIEELILTTLRESDSAITRELRAACGFTGKNMRSKFDAYISRLQMGTYIVTEDFVYPVDKHGREYGFGWSLLTTPEHLLGSEACHSDQTPEESFQRMFKHLSQLLPHATEKLIKRLLA